MYKNFIKKKKIFLNLKFLLNLSINYSLNVYMKYKYIIYKLNKN